VIGTYNLERPEVMTDQDPQKSKQIRDTHILENEEVGIS
jgi:hypothetical protein